MSRAQLFDAAGAGVAHELVADEGLDAALQHAAAHEPVVEHEGSALDAALEHDHQAVVAQPVREPQRARDPGWILGARLDLGRGRAARGQVELVGLVGELQHARVVHGTERAELAAHPQPPQEALDVTGLLELRARLAA